MKFNTNLKAYLPDGDTHFEKVFQNTKEYYQVRALAKAFFFVEEFKCALDIGAHCGLITRVLETMFVEVMAFEPCHTNVACMDQNLNNKYKTDVRQMALSNVAAKGHYYLNRLTIRNSGANEIALPKNELHGDMEAGNKIPVAFLDGKEFKTRINFIKLDTQGEELNILKGAVKTIYEHKPTIMVEDTERHHLPNYLLKIGYTNPYNYKKDMIWTPKKV